AMKADPAPQTNPKCGNLVFSRAAIRQRSFIRTSDPDPDTVFATLTLHIHRGERTDDGLFECGDKCADILTSALEVKHDIGNALPGAVIGIFATAAARKNRKSIG